MSKIGLFLCSLFLSFAIVGQNPGGRGMGAWGRGASGGMQSQSMIGGTSGGGGNGHYGAIAGTIFGK